MTIPRVIIRDLGDHADKKELISVFSRFNSFKNVWVANNPPGFAYVFFDNMKDALKAVASTNGRFLCGGRVRVELTPIEEKEDQQRRMMTSKRMTHRRSNHMRSPSPVRRTPSPGPSSHRNIHYSPLRSPVGSPIVHHKRYSPSLSPLPPPKRRSSHSNRHHYDQSFDESPPSTRGRIHRRVTSPSPPSYSKAPLSRKRERAEPDRHYHRDESNDYSRSGKFIKRDNQRRQYSSGRERYSNRSSPSDSAHLSRSFDSYEREHRIVKDDRTGIFEHNSHRKQIKNYTIKHYTEDINNDDDDGYFPETKGLSMEEEQQEWSLAAGIKAIGEGLQYYRTVQPSSPPPPIPRSSKRNRHSSTEYSSHRELSRHSSSYKHPSVSPSPPPPPPPPPPPLPSQKKSYKNYDTRSSPRRHHERRDSHDRERKKDKEDDSQRRHRHSRDNRDRHRSRKSRSPLQYNGSNRFINTSGGEGERSSSQEQDQYGLGIGVRYMEPPPSEERYQKTATASSPNTRGHQYYEQIEEGNEGFFSEVGYHSGHQSPQEYVKNQSGSGEVVVMPPSSSSHHQIFDDSFDSIHSMPPHDGVPEYEQDRTMGEHYLQIDEVKEIDDDHKEGRGRVGGSSSREVYHSNERKIVITGGRQRKEREVVHRKREREVIVKRSPERKI